MQPHLPPLSEIDHVNLYYGDNIWVCDTVLDCRFNNLRMKWKEFVVDNKLQVGDKCDFILMMKPGRPTSNRFLVTISPIIVD